MSQLEVAEKLAITTQALGSRLKNPTLSSIREIASIIGCEVAELVDDTNKIELIIKNKLHTFYSMQELKDFIEKEEG